MNQKKISISRLARYMLPAIFTLMLLVLPTGTTLAQQQRFPMPEFHTDYSQPDTTVPEPRSGGLEYLDLAVLLAVMSLTTWLVLKKRSRNWIFWVAIFSLIYFGFYRDGCICPVGAVQNLALSLSSEHYAISLTVLAFFVMPLIFSLIVGRVFCASACPLGVIQDLVIVKPIRLSPWLQKTLGLFPFVYLGLAILYASTGTDFIICRYDPFVGIFRLGAEFHMIILGVSFLLIGMFVARPYCRFVCPYGALLNIGSRFSKFHLSITPNECINCKLCKDSCPFDAIDYPTEDHDNRITRTEKTRFIWTAVLLPIFIFLGGLGVSSSYGFLSKAHPDVHLASLLVTNPELMNEAGDNLDIETFLASGKTLDILVAEASIVQEKFRKGGWFLGGFIGLVIGFSLLNQMIYKRRNIYEANRGNCYSCGRCMDYCPVGNPEHPFHEAAATMMPPENEHSVSKA